jgi:uncharacterized membrane protein YhaH (DUF805 family)
VQVLTSPLNDALEAVVSLAIFLPSLAVHVRRLHDTDRTGWWAAWPIVALVVALVGFVGFAVSTAFDLMNPSEWEPRTVLDGASGVTIAFIGGALLVAGVTAIANLVFLLRRGDAGENRFGPPAPPVRLAA